MTKNEIVYNWLNLIKAGRISDDFTPSVNQLSFIADYKRAQYIRQDQTKNYFDTDQFYQDLGCIKMIKVDKAEYCTIGLDCDVLRTEFKIPAIIRLKEKYGLKISAVDRQTRFTIILPERSPFLSNTKFPQLGVKVYFLNGYIYIPETIDIRAINVRAILEKPEQAKTFICDGEACYTNNSDYPMTADMIDLITKDIMNTELSVLMKMIPDEANDGSDKVQN
jgi:hypothetical protein